MAKDEPKMLFILNPGAGKQKIDWKKEITDFFSEKNVPIEVFELPNPCKPEMLRKKIESSTAEKVIAVGGDGTVKSVAEALLGTDRPLGILPGGSANGMARELNIPDEPREALQILLDGQERKIHVVKANDQLCIHLSDIGFNAYVVKKFEEGDTRGMWGYVKAAWNVLWRNRRMKINLQTDDKDIFRYAAMVVIANASQYGNGVVINPEGSLYDDLFEVIVVRKVSFTEIFKMRFTKKRFNPKKTELFQTRSLEILSKHSVHFQVDGETMGKVKKIKAELLPQRLKVIVPVEKQE